MGPVRLFLAWVVACSHWFNAVLVPLQVPIKDNFKFGFNAGYAVLFFYVISGFLITYTLSRNYEPNAGGTRKFYRNRFVRIFSLYWPLVVLTFVLFDWSWTQFLAASPWDQVTGLFLLGQDWNMAFATYPEVHYAAGIFGLRQAWTLGAELTFYIVAPLLMRSWKIGAALLLASFGLRAAFVIAWGPGFNDGIWTYLFIGSTFGFFMLGHLIGLAASHWPVLGRPKLGLAFLAGSVAVMNFGNYNGFDSSRFWASVLLFTAALPGLFEASKGVRWMNLLGDLSYPVYLVHTMVLMAIGPWWVSVGDDGLVTGYASIAAFLVASTLAAAVAHRLLEIPAAQAMRWLVSGRVWRWARAPS